MISSSPKTFVLALILSLILIGGPTVQALANDSDSLSLSPEMTAKIQALEAEIVAKGYKHTVGYSPAAEQSIEDLCKLVLPKNWPFLAPWDDMRAPKLEGLAESLPSRFDWREHLLAPPVRNQGYCGSCWAFATVGPLEFEISRRSGIVVDLSEQYLVSCNLEGYSCANGGWWAHDMHADPGAVLETQFPYVASDVPCGGPYTHPYQIDSWSYIGTWWWVLPSPDQIKQAIYTHGPASVAVEVGSQFQSYSGGVFKANEASGPQDINHGVVLVGWDDTVDCGNGNYGVWILRNSWGSWWGEGGYMRICYGCSNVGLGASYIVFAPIPHYDLTVAKAGTGLGRVTSAPAGIDCGIDCGESYEQGTTVILTATAEQGSVFLGWSGGGCSGTDPCTILMNQSTGVTAQFDAVPPPAAEFVADAPDGAAPHIVWFIDTSANNPTSWLWDFGDGNTSTEQNPVHLYSDAGLYTVILTASNAGGTDDEIKVDYVEVSSSCPNPAVRVGLEPYSSIGLAYGSVGDQGVVEVQGLEFFEILTFSSEKIISLKAGFNCDYTDTASGTLVHGSLTIAGGTAIVENLILQ